MQISLYLNYPEFKPHTILKSVDLIALREGIHGVLKNHYMDYSNGIIKGLVPKIEDDHIVFSEGVIKDKNNIFWTTEKVKLEIPEEEGQYYVYTRVEKEIDRLCCYLSLNKDETDDIELCRFHIRQGAKLNDYHVSMFKNDTVKYNTINLEFSDISNVFNQKIIHFKILELWFNKMKDLNLSFEDHAFLELLVHNNFRVHPLSVSNYIFQKTSLKVENISDQILSLAKILSSLEERIENDFFE